VRVEVASGAPQAAERAPDQVPEAARRLEPVADREPEASARRARQKQAVPAALPVVAWVRRRPRLGELGS